MHRGNSGCLSECGPCAVAASGGSRVGETITKVGIFPTTSVGEIGQVRPSGALRRKYSQRRTEKQEKKRFEFCTAITPGPRGLAVRSTNFSGSRSPCGCDVGNDSFSPYPSIDPLQRVQTCRSPFAGPGRHTASHLKSCDPCNSSRRVHIYNNEARLLGQVMSIFQFQHLIAI